jgi:mono/diheme cytochrome c family protein
MRPSALLTVALCLGALSATAIVGCSTSDSPGGSNGGGMMGGAAASPAGAGSPGAGGMMGGSGSTSYASPGERLFLTGAGSDGQAIPHTASRVARSSLMMGGGGCASCHGGGGRGGTLRTMSGTAIQAPDVTYDALVKSGFTDATIQRAILSGLDENGKPLDPAMPRWQMAPVDLGATIAYLKVLAAQ